MTTYTVFRSEESSDAESGLTLAQAAAAMLQHDGHDFEIRDHGEGDFVLYHTPFSRNGTSGWKPMVATVIGYCADTREEAESAIFLEVVKRGWSPMEAMTDVAFSAMLADCEGAKVYRRVAPPHFPEQRPYYS